MNTLTSGTKRYAIDIPSAVESLTVAESFTKEVLAELPDVPDRERLIHDLSLVASEALTNAIRHGKMPGLPVRLGYCLDLDGITITVTDYGGGFDPDTVSLPDFEVSPEGGYGIFIMKEIMDEVHYEQSTDGNTLILAKRWATH